MISSWEREGVLGKNLLGGITISEYAHDLVNGNSCPRNAGLAMTDVRID